MANGTETTERVLAQRARSCLLCSTLGRTLYADLRDEIGQAPGIWNLCVCPVCGLVWLDPRPLPEEIAKLYHGYYTHASSDEWDGVPYAWGIGPQIRRATRAVLALGYGYRALAIGRKGAVAGRILCRFGLLMDIVGATIMWLPSSPGGQLLDVGCGGGHFLARMQSLGWRVRGVEPDAEAVGVARRHFDLKVYQGTLADGHFPPNEFDAVTMNHVIEHAPHPVELLQECRRVLKVGGRLVVVTPNARSLGRMHFGRAWRGWETPRHLFLFTPETLRICAKRAGLTITILRTTARLAPAIWVASIRLRDKHLSGPAKDEMTGWGMRVWTRVMGLYEDIYGNSRASGEELLLLARKD